MEEKELKQCPFCGADAKIESYSDKEYLAMCTECYGMIENWFEQREEAVNAWNKRVNERLEVK